MNKSEKIEASNNIYSELYNYCLDIISDLVMNEKWHHDVDAGVFILDFNIKKINSDTRVIQINNKNILIKTNEINKYFKIQNFDYIFNMVLNDLCIGIRNTDNGKRLIVREDKLSSIRSRIEFIDDSVTFYNKPKYNEDDIKDTLDFLIYNDWKDDIRGKIINYTIEYDKEYNRAIIKIVDKYNDRYKLLSYKTIDMEEDTYKEFKRSLNEKLNLFNINKYNNIGYNTLQVNDLNETKTIINEFYGEGIKLKKLDF